MASIRVVVTGRVQGVGFRAHVLDEAERLGVVGEVWNRADGGVEAVAEHDSTAVLGEFCQALRNGPGVVVDVAVTVAPSPGMTRFTVGRTR